MELAKYIEGTIPPRNEKKPKRINNTIQQLLDDFSNNKSGKVHESRRELQRRFDMRNQIKINKYVKYSIKFMKMSNDMSYMIVIDENKNIFILSNFEEENANSSNDSGHLLSINKKKKICCSWSSYCGTNNSMRIASIVRHWVILGTFSQITQFSFFAIFVLFLKLS